MGTRTFIHSSCSHLAGVILSALALSSCEDQVNNVTNNVTYNGGILSDPSIMPQVTLTIPANNSVGPFEVYNPGDGEGLPHFVLQFNKLISKHALLESGAVTIEGFDVPVEVSLNGYFYDIPEYSDFYGFTVPNEFGYGQVPYSVDRVYTVIVDTSLVDINGNHLLLPYRFSFEPEPNFRVLEVYPKSGTVDTPPRNTYIGFVFNSRMSGESLSYLHIQPELEGSWNFYPYDSSQVNFVSVQFPQFNTTYTLTVDANAGDRLGNKLNEGFESTFSTTPFEIEFSSPEDGTSQVALSQRISVTFSGPVDTSSIRSSFSIVPATTGIFNISSYGDGFEFIPSPSLRPSTQYSATISASVKAWDETPLPASKTISFSTESFKVQGISPPNGYKLAPRWSTITIYCNTIIDPLTALNALSISPPVVGNLFVSPGISYFSITPTSILEAYQVYTVTVDTTLKTSEGDPLLTSYTFSFSTGP